MASTKSTKSAAELPIGDWQARVALDVDGKPFARYVSTDGAVHKRLPRKIKQLATRSQLRALDKRLTDIKSAQLEARKRLEQTYRNGREWALADWQDRYQKQPLMRRMTERLIWELHHPTKSAKLALGTAPELTGLDGNPVPISDDDYRIRLWHPANTAANVASQWRRALLEKEIRQPLWQAWRPVYSLTDPEKRTALYSNRFAGLLLSQPVFVRVLRNRGWELKSRMKWDDDPSQKLAKPARLMLPSCGLIAEYWGRGAGSFQTGHEYGAPNFEYFATSQIRFYNTSEDSAAGAVSVPLSEVPLRAFCEAMFDIELATGLSVTGLDQHWSDPGLNVDLPLKNIDIVAGQLDNSVDRLSPGELGKIRIELLKWLIPRLAIAEKLELHGHNLKVRGKWHDYEIHTGNAAVRIVGLNRHLCIVTGGNSGLASTVTLPFAGDDILAILLSKAHMLADENTIKDPSILAQLPKPK